MRTYRKKEKKLTIVNKFCIGLAIVLLIGQAASIFNQSFTSSVFYIVAPLIIDAALIYFGGGFFRRSVSAAAKVHKEEANDATIANSVELQRLLAQISDDTTDKVYLSFSRMIVYPLKEEFPKLNGQKSEFRELGRVQQFDFASLGYNSLNKEQMAMIGNYIGRRIFHGEYAIEEDRKYSGGGGDDRIIGVHENVTGTGYTVVTSNDYRIDNGLFQGYYVLNTYGRRLRDERVRARYNQIHAQRKDLL